MGKTNYGFDRETIDRIAKDIQAVVKKKIEVCLVIGGGNIFRGRFGTKIGIDRSTSDYIGMLATVMNALTLQSALERIQVHTRVQSALPMETVCEPYIRRRAIRHMEKGRVVIFAAGLGNPYLTTDTCATLRASEMGCDVLLKGTKVDGVYSEDPLHTNTALRYHHVSYQEVLQQGLEVMDMSSITLARQNRIPIIVFSIQKPGGFLEILEGQGYYTLISEKGKMSNEPR